MEQQEHNSNATFAQLTQIWIERKRGMIKHSSFCNYNLALHHHILPHFGEATQISEDDLQDYVHLKVGAGLGRQSLKNQVMIIRQIGRFGNRKRLFDFDDECQIEYPRESIGGKRHVPTLTMRDHRRLLQHILGDEQMLGKSIGILISLCTGMRIGEVCALRWENVDLVHRTISIRETSLKVYNVLTKTEDYIIQTPKTKNANREIPIPSVLYKALCKVRRSSDSVYVMAPPNENGYPRLANNYRDYFQRMLDRLGIRRITFHGLRHTFATRCIESGCDPKSLSAILGHANITTTLSLYVHTDDKQKRKTLDKVQRFVGLTDDDDY